MLIYASSFLSRGPEYLLRVLGLHIAESRPRNHQLSRMTCCLCFVHHSSSPWQRRWWLWWSMRGSAGGLSSTTDTFQWSWFFSCTSKSQIHTEYTPALCDCSIKPPSRSITLTTFCLSFLPMGTTQNTQNISCCWDTQVFGKQSVIRVWIY